MGADRASFRSILLSHTARGRKGFACNGTPPASPLNVLLGVLGYPNGKTIHSSKLFFEDSVDELEIVVIDDREVHTPE